MAKLNRIKAVLAEQEKTRTQRVCPRVRKRCAKGRSKSWKESI